MDVARRLLSRAELHTGIGGGDCPPPIGVDISEVSGYYSQAAGAMAGLSFTALVLLLGARDEDAHAPRRTPDALMALFVTLFALVAAMVTYSVLAGSMPAGQKEPDGRTTAQELVGGLGFALAIEMLFYAVVLLLEVRAEYAPIGGAARWVTVVVVPLIGLLFLMIGARDNEYIRSLDDNGRQVLCDGSIAVPLTGLVLVAVMALILLTARLADWRARWIQEHRLLTSGCTLAWVVITIFLFVAITVQPPDFVAPRPMIIVFMVVAGGWLTAVGLLTQLGSHDPTGDRARPPGARDGNGDDASGAVLVRRFRWGFVLLRRGDTAEHGDVHDSGAHS